MSAAHLDVEPPEAIAHVGFVLGWHGRELPIYLDRRPRPSQTLAAASRSELGARLARMALRLDHERSVEVAVGLPVGDCTVLWTWVRGSDQVERAQRFSPKPSIVLRMGSSSERLLLWGLREPVPEVIAAARNERLAYALRAPRTRAAPDKLRVPLPGTFLRIERGRPSPVLVTRLGIGMLDYEQITGRLKEPPPKDAWRTRS